MQRTTTDGNGAASHVSYAFTELAVIYPITPSTPMAELADEWAAQGKTNAFGQVPKVVEMQSESGVAGAVHGALVCGALTTTYTAGQGLLLMIPDMYKIAGELLPTVFHVSARALSTHALSIFGDHQDVMACRQTGFAMLCASSVQETADLALVAHLSTLRSSIPFLHFFDGFRTSHETAKIELPDYEEIRSVIDMQDIENFRKRALTPEAPTQRGTAQNADIYFQNREAANSRYLALPDIVTEIMKKVSALTGRSYLPFDYFGASDAENIIVMMGSGCATMEETLAQYNKTEAHKAGLVKVRLYRPFSAKHFLSVLPTSCQKICVLDRTKEAGATAEPLLLDVRAVLTQNKKQNILSVGGRYGLSSKEFTPSMCFSVLKNLEKNEPKDGFTIGINDDVTNTSLDFSTPYHIDNPHTIACKFYGLGSDGTVGANKSSIKIIGDNTPLHVQAYFFYDSKKSGGVTISHLRFGKEPIRAAYLIDYADFLACHNPSYLNRYDMLADCKKNATFLLNCPHTEEKELNAYLPPSIKKQIADKDLRFYVIDATALAEKVGLKGRTGTIMQAAFFYLNQNIIPYKTAMELLKKELTQKFGKKGEEVVEQNCLAIERTAEAIKKIAVPEEWKQLKESALDLLSNTKNEYFEQFAKPILSLKGDLLPVSSFAEDGVFPTNTSQYEKHGIANELPEWISENCIQCNQCAYVCPHACIRPFLFEKEQKPSFPTIPANGAKELLFRIQVSPKDCRGCSVCANVCPAKPKALVMRPTVTLSEAQEKAWNFIQNQNKRVPAPSIFKKSTVKGSQFYPPYFEFSYACAGCGETPYIKILTQLFGEKMLIANATGCSSIYGGSAPICPFSKDKDGQGPAWASSLFEDNAEFGYGMYLANEIERQRLISQNKTPYKKSVWIIGGDGWAYDIGYGGLDHVLASGANVNILVLDSEVYSNTGGQTSKATPLGARARFSANGKRRKKKPLGLMAISYGYVYVAQVSIGANMQQLLNAFTEAEAYDGPSLIIAYTPCIAHGVSMSKSIEEEKLAVESGYWHLYRYNPILKEQNKPAFLLDSKTPTLPLRDFLMRENRFAALFKSSPNQAQELLVQAEKDADERLRLYQNLAKGTL